MFKKNHRRLQIPLTSHVDELPEKLRKRLENSWAGVFYRGFFCRLNEASFEVLYVDFPSRPNVPVNVLVGLLADLIGFNRKIMEEVLYRLRKLEEASGQ